MVLAGLAACDDDAPEQLVGRCKVESAKIYPNGPKAYIIFVPPNPDYLADSFAYKNFILDCMASYGYQLEADHGLCHFGLYWDDKTFHGECYRPAFGIFAKLYDLKKWIYSNLPRGKYVKSSAAQ